jgi:hypothetical protein
MQSDQTDMVHECKLLGTHTGSIMVAIMKQIRHGGYWSSFIQLGVESLVIRNGRRLTDNVTRRI